MIISTITYKTILAIAHTALLGNVAVNISIGAQLVLAITMLLVFKKKTDINAFVLLDGPEKSAMLKWYHARMLRYEKVKYFF